VIHRHLDYPADIPPERLGPAAVDDLLERGDLDEWAPLARAVASEPWGPLAQIVVRLCEAHPMYGTSPLWRAFVANCQARALGGAQASWPAKPPTATLTQVRTARGLSQATVGVHLGMNQSEVSRLERRHDLRLSTLRRYVEAVGGRLHLTLTWPESSGQVELVVGDLDEPAPDHHRGMRSQDRAAKR
jgi:hypothetical protein